MISGLPRGSDGCAGRASRRPWAPGSGRDPLRELHERASAGAGACRPRNGRRPDVARRPGDRDGSAASARRRRRRRGAAHAGGRAAGAGAARSRGGGELVARGGHGARRRGAARRPEPGLCASMWASNAARAHAVSGSGGSGRFSFSQSSSFIGGSFEVGAQLGARAVNAGADRADRDAGGVGDLRVGQVGPGVQQQRVAVGGGDGAAPPPGPGRARGPRRGRAPRRRSPTRADRRVGARRAALRNQCRSRFVAMP